MSIATTVIVTSQAHKHRGETTPDLENIPSYGALALAASLLIAAMGLLVWLG